MYTPPISNLIPLIIFVALWAAYKTKRFQKIRGLFVDKLTESKCIDCKRKAHGFIIETDIDKKFLFFKWKSDNHIPLCRKHLIEHFGKYFVNARQKMIVGYPDFEEEYRTYYQYFYDTIESLAKLCPDKNINDLNLSRMNEWLAMINGKCAKCSWDASVAYFPRFSVPYESLPVSLRSLRSRDSYPMFHKIIYKPVILCKACAFKEIEDSFKASKIGFEQGMCTPDEDKEGIYMAIVV